MPKWTLGSWSVIGCKGEILKVYLDLTLCPGELEVQLQEVKDWRLLHFESVVQDM